MWLVLGNLLSPEIALTKDSWLCRLFLVHAFGVRLVFHWNGVEKYIYFWNALWLFKFSTFIYKYASLNLWCFASLEIRNHFAPWPWLSEDRFCSLKPLFGSFIFHFTLRGNSRKPILYLLWLGILNFSFKGPVAREKTVSTFGKEKGNLLEWWPTELSGLGKSDPQKG